MPQQALQSILNTTSYNNVRADRSMATFVAESVPKSMEKQPLSSKNRNGDGQGVRSLDPPQKRVE